MGINKNVKKKTGVPAAKVPVIKKPQFKEWYALGGILVLTFLLFTPIINNAFTNWDDPTYLLENPLIRNLSAANIKRIFTEIYFGNYQPLHIFSYAIEYHFYKLNPAGYHTTSLLMHLIVTVLVCWFIFVLTENATIALIATLLFGIHPLHVESIAWAAERKDLLYAIFFISALINYVNYIKKNEAIKYFIYALLFFSLSIMSKTMAASLVPVLVLMDFYFKRKFTVKTVLEKIPFFLIAVAYGLYSVHASATTGSISVNVYSLFERILIANFNLLAYVVKLIIPFNLSSYYPYPENSVGNLPYYFYIAPFIVISLLVLIVRSLKKTNVFFFGAGFFVAAVFLVLQLLPVGPAIMAERYTYIPSIGLFFVIAFVLNQLIEKKPQNKKMVYGLLGVYCVVLSVITFVRCDVWKDSFTLWSNVIGQFPHAGIALNNRGNVYGKERGQLDLAMQDFNQSVQFDPNYENAYANRGIVYCMKGQLDLGIADFSKALQLKPDYFEALINRGIAYAQTKQVDKAIADFNASLKIKPDDEKVFLNRGILFLQNGKFNEAINDFNKVLQLNPANAEVYYRRSTTWYSMQRYKEAWNDLQQATALGYAGDANYVETVKKSAQQ